MKYKITSLALALLMLFSCAASASFTDINASSSVGTAIVTLSRLGILNGYGDGSFQPDELLTRAQFAKIAVHMLGEEKNAASYSASTVFGDVPSGSWASGYINYIAERGIINGYPDGSFGADEKINYAQALTILVRMLGYSGEDVGYRWPDGYIAKAEALGITDGISFGKYENVTRGNAAYLAYNTLLADKKEGESSVQLLSSSRKEDIVIYGDQSYDASVASGNIVTTGGTFKLAQSSGITAEDYGTLGTLYLDSEQKAVAFVPEKETKQAVTVVSASKNGDTGKIELSFTAGGAPRTESLDASTPVYSDGKALSLEEAVSKMENGRTAALYYAADGSLARIMLNKSTLEGPCTITTDSQQIYSLFSLSSTAALNVYRKGERASVSDIKAYDVVYYERATNTVYAYADKITGTYEEAYPIKANVTSVKISDKTYNLSSQTAINKMNESDGAFKIGDRVTLLLGRSGDVIDVVDLNATGALDVVVLNECYSKISEDEDDKGQRRRYADVTLPDGNTVTYETDDDYSDYVGSVMKITYSNGIAHLTYVTPKAVTGKFDSTVPSLDGHWLTSDCAILELTEKTDGKATVRKVERHELSTADWGRSQVIHVQMSGSMNDISFLYIKDVTKAESSFGVIKSSGGKGQYKILTDDGEISVTTALKLGNADAVEVVKASDNKTSVKAMEKLASASTVAAYTKGRIRLGSTTYTVSDNVKIYGGVSADEFSSMSEEEMLNSSNVSAVTLYSDQSLKDGGIVRVIVVKTKD